MTQERQCRTHQLQQALKLRGNGDDEGRVKARLLMQIAKLRTLLSIIPRTPSASQLSALFLLESVKEEGPRAVVFKYFSS